MSSLAGFRASTPVPRLALRYEVVKRLLIAIFRGELPPDTRLVVQKLAAQFGISATPIREALLEMEAIGVIEAPLNRGAVVKAFGREQVREIYHLRRILESEAVRCACGRIDRALLGELKEMMTRLLQDRSAGDWSDLARDSDLRLHKAIWDNCGNARLRDEIIRYNTLIDTVREIVGNQHNVQTQALFEHLPILDALLAGQADVAASQMSLHINSTARAIADIMFPTSQWAPPSSGAPDQDVLSAAGSVPRLVDGLRDTRR